jgi:hypothetical protein
MVWQMDFMLGVREERSAVKHEDQDSPPLTVNSLMRRGGIRHEKSNIA